MPKNLPEHPRRHQFEDRVNDIVQAFLDALTDKNSDVRLKAALGISDAIDKVEISRDAVEVGYVAGSESRRS